MGDDAKGGAGREVPRWVRAALPWVLGAAVLIALVFAFLPDAVSVDLATVDRGDVVVAVEEDGRTRVRDRFVVTAPVGGTLRRVELRAGDPVGSGDRLAWLDGPEPSILDPRTRDQLAIRITAAEAGVERARSLVDAAEAGLVEARQEVRRQEVLLEAGGGMAAAVERARALLQGREAELRSARFGVRAAEGEVEDLRAALAAPAGPGGGALELTAPVGGTVLRVHRESAGAIGPGEPILELGDSGALEVVVDLLSADAVRVPAGAEASIRGWGGEAVLGARVRRVEPSGFTRVSALGIEEQRVHVILDLTGDLDAWSALGDGFRVEVRIVLERVSDVIRVPTGALFRRGDGWAVFRVDGNRLVETEVGIGRRSQAEAEVVSGLEPGDRVVLYPGDRVEDGVRFRAR